MKNDYLPIFLAIVAASIAMDRLTKLMALTLLGPEFSLSVLPYLRFTLVTNTGISFGMFKDFPWLAFSAATITIFLICWYYRRIPRNGLAQVGFALILGGAIGNLWDRIVYSTVIDFIDLVVWPVFNVADSAITVGGILIALWMLLEKKGGRMLQRRGERT